MKKEDYITCRCANPCLFQAYSERDWTRTLSDGIIVDLGCEPLICTVGERVRNGVEQAMMPITQNWTLTKCIPKNRDYVNDVILLELKSELSSVPPGCRSSESVGKIKGWG